MNATSPFIPGTGLQYAWDSTTISIAMECPRRYQYEVLEGWQSKSPSVAIELAFGILVHSGIEHYHRERALGGTHDNAVKLAMHFVISLPEYQSLPTEEEFQDAKEEARDDDEADEGALRNARLRTRYFLWRALVWYFEQYRDDPLEVLQLENGKPAVELSFRVPLGFALSDGTEVLLAGHLDKVVRFNESLYVSDIKTTKSITASWRQSFHTSHQMKGYTLAGKLALHEPVAGVVIDGIALQVGGVRFARSFVNHTDSALGEFVHDLQLMCEEYESYAAAGHWPMRTTSCWRCKFKEVCSQPPELRQGYLNHLFRQGKAWNPLESRG